MSMLSDITSSVPRFKKPTRKGRGRATGRGKTAGRGTKGSGAHGGDVHWKPGAEGGQTPIFRRFPKRGFSNAKFERRFHVVNIADLDIFDDGATVDQAALIEKGLVKDDRLPVKILGEGELSKKLIVQAGWFSKKAAELIAAKGGSVQTAKGEAFAFPKPKKKFIPREKPKKAAAEAAPAEEAK